jgi:hypothetical protein
MILEHLEQYLRQEAEKKAKRPFQNPTTGLFHDVNGDPVNPFRASAMGRCIREGCYDLTGLEPEPLQPRRMLTLEHGTVIHDNLLTPLIEKAMGWRVVSGAEFGDCEFEIDGAKISFHIDLAFQVIPEDKSAFWINNNIGNPMVSDQIGVAEIKGWADMTFKKASEGVIDHEILCQGWTYYKGTSFNPIVYLGFRKETSHMVEIVFERDATEKVVTQRTLTRDPIQLAKDDPILLTSIVSPFDLSVEEYVRDRIKWLKKVKAEVGDRNLNLNFDLRHVPGADRVEDEIEKVQGKDNMLLREQQIINQTGKAPAITKNASWYNIPTGRKILGYPCSYCGHKFRCFEHAEMEMKGERPIWVI